MRIETSRWVKPLVRSSAGELVADLDGIRLSLHGSNLIPYQDIQNITLRDGWIWCALLVALQNGTTPYVIKGLPKPQACHFLRVVNLLTRRKPILTAMDDFDALLDSLEYIARHQWKRWMQANHSLRAFLSEAHADAKAWSLLPDQAIAEFWEFRNRYDQSYEVVINRNKLHVEKELEAYREWFDTHNVYPLTQRQRDAILHDEDNTLLLAGAGTGKTSSIVGKVGYLVTRLGVKPSEILLLAFARKAQEEMAERIRALFGILVEVRTFHSFGNSVLSQCEGRRQLTASFALDDEALQRTLEGYIGEVISEPRYRQLATTFFAYLLQPARTAHEFPTKHEYARYLATHARRTLKHDLVRSHEEFVIANWLFVNGIEYRYEAPYEVDTATVRHRQYTPDFYLPKYGIYIEHLGVDREGNTAPFVDREAYWNSIRWKRQLHARCETYLVETYSYDHAEGKLTERLESKLWALGVHASPIPVDELRRQLESLGTISQFAKLLAAFLNHFKSNSLTVEELQRATSRRPDALRTWAFLEVFRWVYEKYQAELQSAGCVDFHDMIVQATQYVERGHYQSPFSYILVDEFQDISRGRYRLLKALLDQRDDCRLFCVGDDWQSIYRFAGSDISITANFEEFFGFSYQTVLDKTFRFNNRILEASGRFIARNPDQIEKHLVASGPKAERPAITVVSVSTDESVSDEAVLARILDRIGDQEGENRVEVMLLARYRHLLPETLSPLQRAYPTFSFDSRTVHAAKGLEADYVLVLGVVSGRFGFPSEIEDDPALELVLPKPEPYPHAEERRLFYVALSRAKKHVFLVTQDGYWSPFIEELEGPDYGGLVEMEIRSGPRIACPHCQGGWVIRKKGPYGPFWSCSNSPYCDNRIHLCLECMRGVFVRREDRFVCTNPECGQTRRICPRCDTGMIIWRTGPRGRFQGCTEYRRVGPSCNYHVSNVLSSDEGDSSTVAPDTATEVLSVPYTGENAYPQQVVIHPPVLERQHEPESSPLQEDCPPPPQKAPRRSKPARASRKTPRKTTYEQTKELLLERLTLEEIAAERGLKEETIRGHLHYLMLNDLSLTTKDLEHLRPPAERLARIQAAFDDSCGWLLKPARDLLGEDFTYEELDIARFFLLRGSS